MTLASVVVGSAVAFIVKTYDVSSLGWLVPALSTLVILFYALVAGGVVFGVAGAFQRRRRRLFALLSLGIYGLSGAVMLLVR